MSLVLRTSSDRFRVSLARAMAAMWRRIGVEVEVRPSESATLVEDLNRGRFSFALADFPEVIEPHLLSWFFASDKIPVKGVEGGNRWRYRNPEVDRLLEAGQSSIHRAERRAFYLRLQAILAEDLPVLPLWHEDVVAIASERAAKIGASRDGRFSTWVYP